jgi:hypothetical protein
LPDPAVPDSRARYQLSQPLPTQLKEINFPKTAFFGAQDKVLFLEPLLKHCAGLERFFMELDCLSYPGDVMLDQLLSPGDLVQILNSQKQTLQYLHLDFVEISDTYAIRRMDAIRLRQIKTGTWYTPRLLSTFSALEELIIDEHSFCRHWRTQTRVESPGNEKTCLTDIVPKTLGALEVALGPGSPAWVDLHYFAQRVGEKYYPNLQKITVSFRLYKDFRKRPGVIPITESERLCIDQESQRLEAKMAPTGVRVRIDTAMLSLGE